MSIVFRDVIVVLDVLFGLSSCPTLDSGLEGVGEMILEAFHHPGSLDALGLAGRGLARVPEMLGGGGVRRPEVFLRIKELFLLLLSSVSVMGRDLMCRKECPASWLSGM